MNKKDTENKEYKWKGRVKEYHQERYLEKKEKNGGDLKGLYRQNYFIIELNGINFVFESRKEFINKLHKIKKEELENINYVKAI